MRLFNKITVARCQLSGRLRCQERFNLSEYGKDSGDRGLDDNWHKYWRNPDDFNRNTVYLNWNGDASYLNDNWYHPTNQWNVGNVFPVASSIILLNSF